MPGSRDFHDSGTRTWPPKKPVLCYVLCCDYRRQEALGLPVGAQPMPMTSIPGFDFTLGHMIFTGLQPCSMCGCSGGGAGRHVNGEQFRAGLGSGGTPRQRCRTHVRHKEGMDRV